MLEVAVELCQQALGVALITSVPLLAALWVSSWVGALVQSALQTQDPALAHLPRVIGLGLALWAFGPWVLERWTLFAERALRTASIGG